MTMNWQITRRHWSIILLIGISMMCSSFSPAEEFRASIIGQVSDPSGAPVPGATVTAVMKDTHQTYTTKSDGAGVYNLDFISPGVFVVTVEAEGFKKEVYSDVTLQATQKLNLNVTLTVGSVQQNVTVTASPGLIDTSTATSGGVISQYEVETEATVGRIGWEIGIFNQGVRELGLGEFNLTLRNNSESWTVDGSPTTTNAFFVNGAPVSTSGSWLFSPNPDAIQEIQVSASGGAEYGPAAGAVMNTIIKPGTDHFHGDVYNYYGNEALNGNTISGTDTGVKKSINIRNTFGGTYGGPIRKDKTFFFAAFEGFRQNEPLPATNTVPTASMRSGNFQGTGYTIYDPTTVTCISVAASGACNTYGRTAFANDTIPTTEISGIGQAMVNLYPMPTTSSVSSNYTINVPRKFSYTQYMGRIDHQFSTSTRIYGLGTFQNNYSTSNSNGILNEANNNSVPTGTDNNIVLDLTHTFSPTLVADTRLSFGRYTTFSVSGTTVADNFTGAKLGGTPNLTMPDIPTTTHLNVVPAVTVNSFAPLFGNTANGTVTNEWYLNPTLAQARGRHTLHYGFEYSDIQSGADGIPGEPNGAFTFAGNFTQQNPLTAASGSGSAIADLLLGYPASGTDSWGINDYIVRHQWAAYAQDTFKVSRTVTLNMGLRWDLATSPTERYNGINGPFCLTCTNPYTAQINYAAYPTLQNPLLGGTTFVGVTAPRAQYWNHLNDWGPRVGVAWAITPKTVFRAGGGLYYSYNSPTTYNNGFAQTTNYVASINGNISPTNYFLLGNPYPNGVQAPTGASLGYETNAGNAVTYATSNWPPILAQHWSIGFQRELPRRILLDVEYAGSKSLNNPVSQPYGVISTAQQQACLATNAICNTSVANPFYGVLPKTATLGASATVPAWELMRQFPLFNGVTQANDPLGWTIYNALQVRAQRQLKDLDFVLAYTYSNTMYKTQYLNSGNFRDADLWYGPWTNDAPHHLTANVVWPIPIGKGGRILTDAHGFLGQVVNGWMSSFNWVAFSGAPLSAPSYNLVGGPGCTSYQVAQPTNAVYFNNNESCYQALNVWQPRTAPLYLGYLRIPFEWQMEANLYKNFSLGREGRYVQFGLVGDNFLNHPIWGAPDTTPGDKPTLTPGIGWTGFGAIGDNTNLGPRSCLVYLKIYF